MGIQMPYSPDEIEQQVLDVLRREGRANPLRIREQTDIRKQYVNNALRQLVKAELVRKVTTGLYEYDGDDGPIMIQPDEAAELAEILHRCDVPGAAMWAERFIEE